LNKKKPRHPADVRASLSISEIALRSGVSESFAYDEVKAGRLRASKLGGTGPLRVTLEDEARWIAGDAAKDGEAGEAA
jgi:hypothetical protein